MVTRLISSDTRSSLRGWISDRAAACGRQACGRQVCGRQVEPATTGARIPCGRLPLCYYATKDRAEMDVRQAQMKSVVAVSLVVLIAGLVTAGAAPLPEEAAVDIALGYC